MSPSSQAAHSPFGLLCAGELNEYRSAGASSVGRTPNVMDMHTDSLGGH
jgi:hypothetical protein